MKGIKNTLLIFSAVMILLPAAVSFSHIFTGHSHKLCKNYSDKHYHKKSLDCKLHKFHKNPALKLEFTDFESLVINEPKIKIYDHYQFLSDYQKLSFELRGPPVSV